jgi:hypothetical protein
MSTLRSKLTNSVTNSRKISIWINIAVQINSLGLHNRTDKEVKTKWQNMQTSAKKQYADRKKYATQTGGISELSQFELLFLLSSAQFSFLFFYINRENARAMLNCGILNKV